MINRRQFLVYLGIGTYSAMRSTSLLAGPAPFPLRRRGTNAGKFKAIAPSSEDRLILPAGFKSEVIASFGDPLGSTGPFGAESFGYDNDFLAYFPIDALTGGKNPHEGLLWVNHENANPLFVSGYEPGTKKTRDQIQAEKLSVGGGIIHVRRDKKGWKRVEDSKYTRRVTALYPEMDVSGPGSAKLAKMTGSLGNCSGGRTLWSTALTCEENFQNFNPIGKNTLGWSTYDDTKLDENGFGWVVEIDPFGELPPTKHTALGRFSHENAAMRLGASGRLTVYMGDDDKDQYLYKYVSQAKYDPKASRAEKRKLLSDGTLYAADFIKGEWIALDLNRQPALKEAGFKTQADVLFETRKAATVLKATPIDRPEDCEVHPLDGSVYIALTNNDRHGNLYGQIVRLVENGDDAESEKFRYELFLAGGPQSGLACPDNLAFDRDANLWVACDISSSVLNKGSLAGFRNNGLFMVPTKGKNQGEAFQFASSPVDAELTGPWFNENYDTLFLSVQHPGEGTTDLKKPTSRWPSGKDMPRPSVVAITGF